MLLYPINLNIKDKLCVVIGGGGVALRKVRGLLAARAKVRVVSPEVVDDMQALAQAGEIEWLRRGYVYGDLLKASLVFAATNNRVVQEQIAAEAEKHDVLMNSGDDPQGSDFHLPASFRRGQLLITVSTSGGSPALSSRLRRQLECEIGPEYEQLVYLLSLIREKVVGLDEKTASHTILFHRLLELPLVELVKEKNWFKVQMLLLEELPADIDGVAIMKRFIERHGSDC